MSKPMVRARSKGQAEAENEVQNLSQKSFTIRDLAQFFDITPRTLRFYEDKGLLTPARNGGVRAYSLEDRYRVEKILRAKRLGFSLDGIRDFFEITDGHVFKRSELLLRKQTFEKVIKRLGRQRKDIGVVQNDLRNICTVITEFLEQKSDSDEEGIFEHAQAYDAVFRQYLDDDFSTDKALDP